MADGRWIKVLTIVDAFSKEAVDLVAGCGSPGQYVTRVLDQAARFRGYPNAIRTDQGSEFSGKALDQSAHKRGVQPTMIQAGKPPQNALIESFNGRFREERLYDQRFTTRSEARVTIVAWHQDYNQCQPHSSLDYQTPAEFAAKYGVVTSASPTKKEHL